MQAIAEKRFLYSVIVSENRSFSKLSILLTFKTVNWIKVYGSSLWCWTILLRYVSPSSKTHFYVMAHSLDGTDNLMIYDTEIYDKGVFMYITSTVHIRNACADFHIFVRPHSYQGW